MNPPPNSWFRAMMPPIYMNGPGEPQIADSDDLGESFTTCKKYHGLEKVYPNPELTQPPISSWPARKGKAKAKVADPVYPALPALSEPPRPHTHCSSIMSINSLVDSEPPSQPRPTVSIHSSFNPISPPRVTSTSPSYPSSHYLPPHHYLCLPPPHYDSYPSPHYSPRLPAPPFLNHSSSSKRKYSYNDNANRFDMPPSHCQSNSQEKHRKTSLVSADIRKSPSLNHISSATLDRFVKITCYHATVAQKSYGSEKRFLCPPPTVQISNLPDPTPDSLNLSMLVICDRNAQAKATSSDLDANKSATFKYLYVTGSESSKPKSFHLQLHLQDKLNHPFITIDSSPINIISKPSKTTSKNRNGSSCIVSGSSVCLFNRINSQTVRTKYMAVDDETRLCAKSNGWSVFTVDDQLDETSPTAVQNSNMKRSIHYGSKITLCDQSTGYKSEPLFIRKVEKNDIIRDASGPVSQMQKVALEKVKQHPLDPPLFLSAAIANHADHHSDANLNSISLLSYQTPKTISSNVHQDGVQTSIEKIDDFLCWTIVGISKFEYSYYENSGPVRQPISPFPSITSSPAISSQHSLELSIKNYLQFDHEPLQIFIGRKGPIKAQASRPLHTSSNSTPSESRVQIHLPPLDELKHAYNDTKIPIFFVRNDGIVYHSGKHLLIDESQTDHSITLV